MEGLLDIPRPLGALGRVLGFLLLYSTNLQGVQHFTEQGMTKVMDRSQDAGARLPLWLWASKLASLSLSFPICKLGRVVLASQDCCET